MKKRIKIFFNLTLLFLFCASHTLYANNLFNCKHGFDGCNLSLLTEGEKQQVKKSELSRNLFVCKHGFDGCNLSLLTEEEKQQVKKREDKEVCVLNRGICTESGSCYGDISNITSLPKTIRVNGYYRHDGTYVRGHYRSKR